MPDRKTGPEAPKRLHGGRYAAKAADVSAAGFGGRHGDTPGWARLIRNQRQPRRDNPPTAGLVDDINAVVLPIRPGDAEEEREPAPEAEPPLLGQPRLEDELVPQAPKITTLLLGDAVEEDLKVRPDTSRKLHARLFAHPP